jgi:hypothetical protein
MSLSDVILSYNRNKDTDSWLTLTDSVTKPYDQCNHFLSSADSHIRIVSASHTSIDLRKDIAVLKEVWLSEFAKHNIEQRLNALTLNDVRCQIMAIMWYVHAGRRVHINGWEQRLTTDLQTDSESNRRRMPRAYTGAELLCDVGIRVASMACRHSALASVPMSTQRTSTLFPDREQLNDLYNDISFICACIMRQKQSLLIASFSSVEEMMYGNLTEEQQKTRRKWYMQPSTVALLNTRKHLTMEETPAQQGWLWKEDMTSCIQRFIPMCNYTLGQIEYELGLLERYPMASERCTLPYHARENAHQWLVKRFDLEQPESLINDIREQVCEHFLPMGVRIHSQRARSNTKTTLLADLLMERYAGPMVASRITDAIATEDKLAVIAKDQNHPLFGYVFLAMANLLWYQQSTLRNKDLYLYRDYVIPCSTLLMRDIDWFDHTWRFNNTPRPVLILLGGQWRVFFKRQWHAIPGDAGNVDALDAVLVVLYLIREHCDYKLENNMPVRDIAKHFFIDDADDDDNEMY